MTTRLNALATLIDGENSFGFTNYENLQADIDYLAVPGADLASATTIDITSWFHNVTGNTTIDSIVDTVGAVGGQPVKLRFGSALLIRNNGGGSGNIRTASGLARAVAAGELIEFVYDAGSTVWRERAKQAVEVLYRDATLVDIVSSSTETDLFGTGGSGIVLPANVLATLRKIRIRIEGDFINNTGGANGPTFKVYYGSGSVSGTSASVSTSASRKVMNLEVSVAALGATNSQWIRGRVDIGAGEAARQIPDDPSGSPLTVDSTADQNLRVTATLSANSANLELRKRHVTVEVI